MIACRVMTEIYVNNQATTAANAPSQARAGVPGKFDHPDFTADGSARASVALSRLETLWINTGTLCNIECDNCYIASSPRNDRLVYFTQADAAALYDEIERLSLPTTEIGFTGGEPFMNPDMLAMAGDALGRGFEVLILTNAMQPMQRIGIREGLLRLKSRFGGQLTLRVSLDHYTQMLHERERGSDSWQAVLDGIDWLAQHGFNLAIAGRTCWNEPEDEAREGYRDLFKARGWPLEADNPAQLLLFPEMDDNWDVAEITTDCWGILNIDPDSIMCASSRMAVKRKGAETPVILPCTLLPYDTDFEMGATLAEAARADGAMFDKGAVKLNHRYCSKFCVLGGGSCTA